MQLAEAARMQATIFESYCRCRPAGMQNGMTFDIIHYENPKFLDAFNVNSPTSQIQSVHRQIVVHDRILMVSKTFLQRLV